MNCIIKIKCPFWVEANSCCYCNARKGCAKISLIGSPGNLLYLKPQVSSKPSLLIELSVVFGAFCSEGPSHDGEPNFMDHGIFKVSREQLNRAIDPLRGFVGTEQNFVYSGTLVQSLL